MAKTKQDIKNVLAEIEAKIDSLMGDFSAIKQQIKDLQKRALNEQDMKKVADLKNKIASL